MADAITESVLTQCLRVSIASQTLYLPVDRVERVVECSRTPPPPLGLPFVSGLVVQGREVLVCFRLLRASDEVRQIKAVLVRGVDFGYLVEIDQMLGFASISASGPPSSFRFEWPVGWVRVGGTAQGEEALWLDAEETFRSLTSAAA